MSDYNLLLQLMSEICLSSMCFTVFIPGPVTTGFLLFFAVPVRGSWILKLSGTGPVCGPSKKGYRTETGPDFKALSIKKLKWIAAEHNEDKRAEFIYHIAEYTQEQLGFIDETSKDEKTPG
jgi:hypothetical protein